MSSRYRPRLDRVRTLSDMYAYSTPSAQRPRMGRATTLKCERGDAEMTVEQERLQGDGSSWRKWGPYVSERAWGTVREDYSADGTAWDYFPHDPARPPPSPSNPHLLARICT